MTLATMAALVALFVGVFGVSAWALSRVWELPVRRQLARLGRRQPDDARRRGNRLRIEADDAQRWWPVRLPASVQSLLQRLARLAVPHQEASPGAGTGAAPVGADVASLSSDAESWLRLRFLNAGIASPHALASYFGLKALLTLSLPLLALVALGWLGVTLDLWVAACLLGLAAAGYYLPNLLLAQAVRRRQRELFEAFPDALDLMRVCMEAGLGLDGAVDSVGREIAISSPALSQELSMLSLQLRAGTSRVDALRNLALRVGLEDIDMLVSMLIQADRFGTGLAESLRVHAESLRIKRRLVAEERAARLPVLLLLPLVVCIFPSLLAVLMGPPVIRVLRVLVPAVGGSPGM
ncbi:MAG: type II secretion system F family protein [Betaproteobacteria bacterium]|nr:type II secretion system F family protein [Betaproteobacteria bacterium]